VNDLISLEYLKYKSDNSFDLSEESKCGQCILYRTAVIYSNNLLILKEGCNPKLMIIFVSLLCYSGARQRI
jgi:hypothetical protein